MKNLYFILIAVFFSGNSIAGNADAENLRYGDAFIFVEKGVEFAVYPDGQFDFTYNIGHGFNSRAVRGHSNWTYNSGYNYNPFVQFDDYGAVIQIKNVPVFYDYYGRVIRTGRISISYNHFGKISRIGNMRIFYNPYQQVVHTAGFINPRNAGYTFKPWHRYYQRPYGNNVIVYHQPYRAHYFPFRRSYDSYKKYYRNETHPGNYYRPGERIRSYNNGRRTTSTRDLSEITGSSDRDQEDVRSNLSSRRRDIQKREHATNARQSSRTRDIRSAEQTRTAEPEREVRRTIRRRNPEVNQTPQSRVRRSESTTDPVVRQRGNSRSSRGRGD